jgi:hypothetical protein
MAGCASFSAPIRRLRPSPLPSKDRCASFRPAPFFQGKKIFATLLLLVKPKKNSEQKGMLDGK